MIFSGANRVSAAFQLRFSYVSAAFQLRFSCVSAAFQLRFSYVSAHSIFLRLFFWVPKYPRSSKSNFWSNSFFCVSAAFQLAKTGCSPSVILSGEVWPSWNYLSLGPSYPSITSSCSSKLYLVALWTGFQFDVTGYRSTVQELTPRFDLSKSLTQSPLFWLFYSWTPESTNRWLMKSMRELFVRQRVCQILST